MVSDPAPDIEKRRNVCPLGGAGAVRGGGRSASGSLARRGLQHIGACPSVALYAADAVRKARGASERRAGGAGRARGGQGCAPSRPNMLLRLHHGVPMECASAALRKLALCRKKSNRQTALTERRGRSLRFAWSKPMLAIPNQICKRGACSTEAAILPKRTVGRRS